MRIVPYPLLSQENVHRELITALQKGQILAYPTDTIYGLGGRADEPTVCQTINRLKKRPSGQIYSVALGSFAMLTSIISYSNKKEASLLNSILPGPYTLIVNLIPAYRIPANQYQSTLGIRIPHLPLILKLIDGLDAPLITTSINHSGERPLNQPAEIIKQFPEIDILIDDGNLPKLIPSTILDISKGEPYTILRQGAGLDRLTSRLEELSLDWIN